MKTVILHDGILSGRVVEKGYRVMDTSTLDIKPCYNCGKCQSSGTGLCAHKDDIGIALHAIANAKVMILVHALYFGTYSPSIKKVLDKLMLLGGNPYFEIHGRKIAHKKGNAPLRVWVALAYKDHPAKEEEAIFHSLVSENADITGCENHASYVVQRNQVLEVLEHLLEDAQ